MAIVFALDVNFGPAEAAARAAGETVLASAPLTAGGRGVPLHKPLITQVTGADGGQWWQLSVLPIGVGWGVATERGQERLRLTAAEYTELGHGLYQLLRRLTGYRAAQAGWEAAWRIDLAELRDEYADELAAGDLEGLVLAENVLAGVRGAAFRPFAPGYVWVPYTGETASSLTAD